MSINYRSARKIIETAGKLAWQEKSEDAMELQPCSNDEGFVRLFAVRDELEEARLLSRKIASLIIYGDTRKYQPAEIAILVRNNYQIDLIAECLQALHVPFEISGDMKFFKSEEVIALASLLKVSASSGSKLNESLQRAFGSPVFALNSLWVQGVFAMLSPAFTMQNLLERISNSDFSELPDADDETRVKAASFAETVRILENCVDQPLSVVFARLLLTISSLLRNPESPRARNILHFRNMIADYCEVFAAKNGRQPLVADLMPDFDEWLTYYASTLEQTQETPVDGVRIMTVHQSKGLEFPVVVIGGLCEGQFPVNLRENLLVTTPALEKLRLQFDKLGRDVSFFNPYPTSHEEHLEEERRLFFVALTRAKEGVIMSFPGKIGSDPALPAPFLSETGLSAEAATIEERPLTVGEFRTRLTRLTPEEISSFEPVLAELEPQISPQISVHGIRPRAFATSEMDTVHLPEEFTFSASSLSNYIDCPRRFFFLNVLRIQNPLVARQPYFVVGNAFHACLEKLHSPQEPWEKGKQPDDADLDLIFAEMAQPMLNNIEFFQRHLETSSIKEALQVYREAIYGVNQLPPRGTIGVEYPFSFTFNGCRFRGRFDRLVRNNDGGVIVVDYKTAASGGKNSEKIYEQAFPESGWPREMQMPLYLLACREKGFKQAAAVLLYVKQDAYKKNFKGMQAGFLRSAALNMGCGPEYGINVADDDFARFADRVRQILDEIKLDRTFDCRPSAEPEARSCLNFNQNKQPACEFFPFCQERLEAQRQQRSIHE